VLPNHLEMVLKWVIPMESHAPWARRDIKPENIVLEDSVLGGRVYLVDFGGVQASMFPYPDRPRLPFMICFRYQGWQVIVIQPCQLKVIMLHGPAAVHTRLVRRVCAEPIHRADPNGVAVMLQAAAAGGGMMGTTIIGTYGYMAPEQFRGAAQPASDLYALGGTLLFLLSGTAADPHLECSRHWCQCTRYHDA